MYSNEFIIFFKKMNNFVNNQSWNHLLDLFQFFEYFHMLLNHFVLVDKKKNSFLRKQHRNLLLLQLKKNIARNLFSAECLPINSVINQLNDINYWFGACVVTLTLTYFTYVIRVYDDIELEGYMTIHQLNLALKFSVSRKLIMSF